MSNPQKAQHEYYFQDNLPPYNLYDCLHLYAQELFFFTTYACVVNTFLKKAGKQMVMYMHYNRLTVLYYLCPVFGPPIHSQPAKQNKRIKPIFIQT